MIRKIDKSRYQGICEICEGTTPIFSSWRDCLAYLRENNYYIHQDVNTKEWRHTCPKCKL